VGLNQNTSIHQFKNSQQLLLLSLSIALFLTLINQWEVLWDKYRVAYDVQNFYWMARYQDPDLFPVDYKYLSDNSIVLVELSGLEILLLVRSIGYGLLFWGFSFLADPILLFKLLVFILMPFSVFIIYKHGISRGNHTTAFTTSVLFIFFILSSPDSIGISAGFQRSFAIPLIILFLYLLIHHKNNYAALLIVIGILIYPPVSAIMAVAYALNLIKAKNLAKLSLDLSPKRSIPLLIALFLCLPFLLFTYYSQLGIFKTPVNTSFPSGEHQSAGILDDARYQEGGVISLHVIYPFLGRLGLFDEGADFINFLILITFAIILFFRGGIRTLSNVPREVWTVLFAGFIMYTISLITIYLLDSTFLYLPSRYTRVTLFLVTILFIGFNWHYFFEGDAKRLMKTVRLFFFFWICVALSLFFVDIFMPELMSQGYFIILFLVFIFSGLMVGFVIGSVLWIVPKIRAWIMSVKGVPRITRAVLSVIFFILVVIIGKNYMGILGWYAIDPSPASREVYEYISTLPKDTLVMGDPALMSGVPLYSKRSVLFRKLFPSQNAPVLEFFDAYYAESPQKVIDFCSKYDISYLVINHDHYSTTYLSRGDFFYNPYNEKIIDITTSRSDFILPNVNAVYGSGEFNVIKCDSVVDISN
jgi:hypothetical protein